MFQKLSVFDGTPSVVLIWHDISLKKKKNPSRVFSGESAISDFADSLPSKTGVIDPLPQ